MYLVDIDILIWILRGNKQYEELLQKYKNKNTLSISTLTIAEIYKNIFPEEYVKTEKLLQEFKPGMSRELSPSREVCTGVNIIGLSGN